MPLLARSPLASAPHERIATRPPESPRVSHAGWRATASALCAILVGIGLARFAYTPLIPALVEAGWFTPAQAAYLGAANLAGYLAGALAGRALAARIPIPILLRGMMLFAAASFFACAAPLPFSWFIVWRFGSGLAGAVLMVIAPPAVLPCVPAQRRGLAAGRDLHRRRARHRCLRHARAAVAARRIAADLDRPRHAVARC